MNKEINQPQIGEIWTDGIETWEIIAINSNKLIKAKSTLDGRVTEQYQEYFESKID